MNEEEIKALSERALDMLEEQKAEQECFDGGKLSIAPEYEMTDEDIEWWERSMKVAKEDFARAMGGIFDDVVNPAVEEYKTRINEMIEQEEHNDKTI